MKSIKIYIMIFLQFTSEWEEGLTILSNFRITKKNKTIFFYCGSITGDVRYVFIYSRGTVIIDIFPLPSSLCSAVYLLL